jgi:hypothetical protein
MNSANSVTVEANRIALRKSGGAAVEITANYEQFVTGSRA